MEVTASEFQRNFGQFKELAQREAVTVTSNGRPSVVLISVAEFAILEKLRQEHASDVGDEFQRLAQERAATHKDVLDGLSK